MTRTSAPIARLRVPRCTRFGARVAPVVLVAMLAGLSRSVSGQKAISTTPRPQLISVDELAKRLGDPKLVVLQVSQQSDYDAGHIPGARFLDLMRIATGPSGDFPAVDDLRRTFESLGVSDDSRIVVYSASGLSRATRTIFTLHHMGLGSQTALLDGGLVEWKRTNHPVTTEPPPVRPGTLTARPPLATVVDANFVRDHVRKPGFVIIDAREQAVYDRSEGPRPGHIPGAVSIPFNSMVDDMGRLKSDDALREIFAKAGISPTDTLIAYCNNGYLANDVIFAARLLGYDSRLYDGSFRDWSRRELPLETSSAKR